MMHQSGFVRGRPVLAMRRNLTKPCVGKPPLLTSHPQRHSGELHGFLDHPEQVIRKTLEIHLITQPDGELLYRPGRVVPAPVGAPVDEALNASPSGTKESGHGQRGPGYGEA
jgi:hypothetical protein